MLLTTIWTNIKPVDKRASYRQTEMDLESHRCSVRKQKSVLFSFLKSAFCLSTSPKAPCWRFPILAMTMSEQALTLFICLNENVLFSFLKSAFCLSTSPKAPRWRFPILAMTMSEQARHCSFGLTKTFLFLCVRVYWCNATHVLHSSNNYFPKAMLFVYN